MSVREERRPAATLPPSSMTGRIDGADPPGARAPLPTDPRQGPALGADFRTALEAALTALELDLGMGLRTAIESQVRLLLAWNEAINLTAIREPAAIALEHVADALAALAPLAKAGVDARPALVDLGSGAGYPGLPLGLALPAGRVTLVDSIGKKARFLQVAGDAALAAMTAAGEPVPELEVVADRAEAMARGGRHRGQHDVVTARAVGPLSELAELALPLLRPGGLLVAWKREGGASDPLGRELADADRLLPSLGGAIEAVARVAVPGLEDHRLVLIRAMRPTPSRYPRPPAERRRVRA